MVRSICANYCDDIRSEIGNKISLVGVYSGDLIVPEIPTILPKLCVFVQIFSELGEGFEGDIEVRFLLDDEIIATIQSPVPEDKDVKPDTFRKAVTQVAFTPLFIEKECILRVRAYCNGKEFKAPALRIKSHRPLPDSGATAEL